MNQIEILRLQFVYQTNQNKNPLNFDLIHLGLDTGSIREFIFPPFVSIAMRFLLPLNTCTLAIHNMAYILNSLRVMDAT